MKKNLFAFLVEPASYTVDRNLKVYVPMGVNYCYLHGVSEAKNIGDEGQKDVLDTMNRWKQVCYVLRVLRRYDKIICNGYTNFPFIILFLFNYWYGRTLALESDTQYREGDNCLKSKCKRAIRRAVFSNKYVHGLAGGEYSHKDYFRKNGMADERVHLMPMVVDNDYFDNPSYAQKEMQPLRLVFVGRLIELKNLDFTIRAFLKFNEQYKYAEFHIVGSGELESLLREKFECESVIFEGAKFGDELLQVYKDNHILILPSFFEQWGLVVNEAMAAGMPVLVSDKVGTRYDLVDNRETGFVFKSDEESSLVDVLFKISDLNTYRTCADNAYKLMHEHWNYELYMNCLKDFIEQ